MESCSWCGTSIGGQGSLQGLWDFSLHCSLQIFVLELRRSELDCGYLFWRDSSPKPVWINVGTFCCCFLSLTCSFFNAASCCKSSQWGSSLLWKPQLRAHVWWGVNIPSPLAKREADSCWQSFIKPLPTSRPRDSPVLDSPAIWGVQCPPGCALGCVQQHFQPGVCAGTKRLLVGQAHMSGWAGRDGFWGGGEGQCQQSGGNFLISERAENCQDASAPGLELVMLWECSTGRIQESVLTMKLPTLGPILWNFNILWLKKQKWLWAGLGEDELLKSDIANGIGGLGVLHPVN